MVKRIEHHRSRGSHVPRPPYPRRAVLMVATETIVQDSRGGCLFDHRSCDGLIRSKVGGGRGASPSQGCALGRADRSRSDAHSRRHVLVCRSLPHHHGCENGDSAYDKSREKRMARSNPFACRSFRLLSFAWGRPQGDRREVACGCSDSCRNRERSLVQGMNRCCTSRGSCFVAGWDSADHLLDASAGSEPCTGFSLRTAEGSL